MTSRLVDKMWIVSLCYGITGSRMPQGLAKKSQKSPPWHSCGFPLQTGHENSGPRHGPEKGRIVRTQLGVQAAIEASPSDAVASLSTSTLSVQRARTTSERAALYLKAPPPAVSEEVPARIPFMCPFHVDKP